MKKNLYILLIIIIICILIVCSLKNNKKNTILKEIEINSNKCELEKEFDTHGGFLGDGSYYAQIKCSKLNYKKLSKNWKKLPLSESLNQVTQTKWCDNKTCKNIYEKYSIPDIKNGYYYFMDRHRESNNKYDDTNINNRASWNFTLAIINKDTNTIYYYELDT